MHELAGLDDEEAKSRARELGREIGAELKGWGFDINFAPVLDVNTNPDNPVIGDRAFADEPEAVALRALAFAEGLAEAGIVGCGKHFPGHGDTSTDSHLTLPRLDHEMSRLESVELLPFRRAIAAGFPMLMTAHVVFAALDESVPATLSPKVVTGLLREKLGFQGVIVSDDMDMKAIADNFGVGDAALMALVAGCDVLLLCRDRDHQEAAREALISESEKSAAFRRIVGRAADRVSRLTPG
jgi:beta-N-acetylhexosaminidase